MPLLSEQNDDVKGWLRVRRFLKERFGKRPDLNAALFLIGMNEVQVVQPEYTKEDKQDLMHVAMCRILESEGLYRFERYDDDGWPHFVKLADLPPMRFIEQERFLKRKVAEYFERKGYLSNDTA